MRNGATLAQHSTAQQDNCALFSYISLFSRQAREFPYSFARRLSASKSMCGAINRQALFSRSIIKDKPHKPKGAGKMEEKVSARYINTAGIHRCIFDAL